MLDFLRKNATGPLGIALIILLVFAFSIWGVGDIFRGYNANVIAKIGDREIDSQNYLFRFNRELNRVSSELNRLVTTEEAKNAGLHYQVLERMLVETSINVSGDTIGLAVSEEALKKRILSTSAFKNAFNLFDRNIFQQVLRQNGLTEDSYLKIEADFHVQEQVANSILSNINPPKPLNQLLYEHQFERRAVDYIIISPSNKTDSSEISDQESLEFYNQNKSKYQTNETRDFSFIPLIIKDISSKFIISDKEIISYYEDNKYDYFEPEKRSYDLIPFTSEKEALKALMDYKKNNDLRELLAKRGLDKSDVDQGLITIKEGMSVVVSNKAFASSIEELSGPVESPFGPALIFVRKIITEKEILLEDVKVEVVSSLQKDKAQDKIYQIYAEIEDSRAGGKTIEEIALEKNLPISTFASVTSLGKKSDGSYIDTPLRELIIDNVFGNDTDIEIDPIEDEDGNIIFLRVDNINTPEQIPYKDINLDIKNTISKNKSITKMRQEALVIFNNLKSESNNLEYISDKINKAVAKSVLLSRLSTSEIFSNQALEEIFKTDKGFSFISNVGVGSSKIIGVIREVSLLEKTDELENSINVANKTRLVNNLAESLSEEHQKEFTSEIFPERLEILFESQESDGSF